MFFFIVLAPGPTIVNSDFLSFFFFAKPLMRFKYRARAYCMEMSTEKSTATVSGCHGATIKIQMNGEQFQEVSQYLGVIIRTVTKLEQYKAGTPLVSLV